MPVKVAINGFGRIGRLVFRILHGAADMEIVAVNDLTSPKMLAYLLKYDTAHGLYDKSVAYTEKAITVGGNEITIISERDPMNLPWASLGIDVVLECTGLFTSRKSASAHIEAGAKKVVISSPAGDDLPTIVYGVNENIIGKADTIISTASCTTNCLAPMAYTLNKLAAIQKGFMTTVHAYTNDQSTLDSPRPKGDLRRTRAAAGNIIPQPTGAAKAIGLVIPELSGRLDGSAQRVPVLTGSIAELVAAVEAHVTAEQVNEAMKAASSESFGYTDEEIVSSDVIGMAYGSLFDSTQTKVMGMGGRSLVKVAAWYDNESSYANQMARVIRHIAAM